MVFFINELKSLSKFHLSVTKRQSMFELWKNVWRKISLGGEQERQGRQGRSEAMFCISHRDLITVQIWALPIWNSLLLTKGIDPAGMWVSIWALENSGNGSAVCTSVTQFFTKMMFPEDWTKVTYSRVYHTSNIYLSKLRWLLRRNHFPTSFWLFVWVLKYTSILYEKPNTSHLVKKINVYLSNVLNIHK